MIKGGKQQSNKYKKAKKSKLVIDTETRRKEFDKKRDEAKIEKPIDNATYNSQIKKKNIAIGVLSSLVELNVLTTGAIMAKNLYSHHKHMKQFNTINWDAQTQE